MQNNKAVEDSGSGVIHLLCYSSLEDQFPTLERVELKFLPLRRSIASFNDEDTYQA